MTRYPLTWPAGWPRRDHFQRVTGKFGTCERRGTNSYPTLQSLSVAEAVQRVVAELDALGVREGDSIISTNLPTRLDGLPRGDAKVPDDPGCAVYWTVRGANATKVMAIDQYLTVADNLAAIAATLNAMRAIERHGGAQILERAFTGFDALPAPGQGSHWRDVLDVPADSGNKVDQLARAKDHYRVRASARHPDKGGTHEGMAALNQAWEAAQKELA